jgi:general L-amino acid transport system permease protein
MTAETRDVQSKPNPLYDPKVRAIIAQIVVVVLFVGFVLYIIDNTQANLERNGVSAGFDFMGLTAGFMPTGPDFNMTNFDMNTSTHGDVFILGLVNTILISVVGIVLATIVGFVMGVLRLSSNVLINFVATCYIEVTRNIPLLLQILVWYFGVFLLLPHVKQSFDIFGVFFLNSRYLAFPSISFDDTAGYALVALIIAGVGIFLYYCFGQYKDNGSSAAGADEDEDDSDKLWMLWMLIGYVISLPAASIIRPLFSDLSHLLLMNPVTAVIYGVVFVKVVALIMPVGTTAKPVYRAITGLLVGLPMAGFFAEFGMAVYLALNALVAAAVGIYAIAGWAQRRLDETGRPLPVFWMCLGLVIGLPLVVLIVSGFPVNFDVPALKGFNFRGGAQIPASMMGLLAALTFYTGAFIAENVRAGIQAVSHGQTEAASALGIRPGKTMRLVIIPQAMRVIVPPVTSQYLNLTKNSSLAIAIGYPDLVNVFTGISLNQTGKALEIIAMTMLVYLTISLLISLFMNWYNTKVALVER